MTFREHDADKRRYSFAELGNHVLERRWLTDDTLDKLFHNLSPDQRTQCLLAAILKELHDNKRRATEDKRNVMSDAVVLLQQCRTTYDIPLTKHCLGAAGMSFFAIHGFLMHRNRLSNQRAAELTLRNVLPGDISRSNCWRKDMISERTRILRKLNRRRAKDAKDGKR